MEDEELLSRQEKQVREWMQGNPYHDKETDTCCPDFACCTGVLSAAEVREEYYHAYMAGDPMVQQEMIMKFMQDAMKIYQERESTAS